MIDPIAPSARPQGLSVERRDELRAAAERLEASFLTEMLKEAGLGAREGAFGGGIGEDQFMSLMRAEHADLIVEQGGIGLAETLFKSLVQREERNA